MIVYFDDLAGGNESKLPMRFQQGLHPARNAHHGDLYAQSRGGLCSTEHDLLGGVVAAHAVDRDAKGLLCCQDQMSRLRTALACAVMNFFRGSTSLPMSFSKTSLTVAASSTSTCSSVRVAGFMVVSQS